MSDAALTAGAALGASALTGLASLGVVGFQEWRRNRAAAKDALHVAVITVLSRSLSIILRADTMRAAVEQRSGLAEGVDIATRVRKPLDHFAFHDWLAQDWTPLNEAWSEIWMRGDQETVGLTNDVVVRSAEVLAIRTTRQTVATGLERARQWFGGEKWTPEMVAGQKQRVEALAAARKRLVAHARQQLGYDAVEVFAQGSRVEVA